jgi:NADH dehydrogenase
MLFSSIGHGGETMNSEQSLTTIDTGPASPSRPRVVIVGGGFGGVSAARALGNRDVDVLVLSRADYHGFWMLLYQVAAAQLEPAAIAAPVRGLLRRYRNVRFQAAEVTGVDLERRLVRTVDQAIPYDYLILAAGSATHYFGQNSFRANSLALHDLDEAERLRERVLAAFAQAATEPDPARRAALMTVIVVGGGPTGVELAGAFAELIRGPLARDYPTLDMGEARVLLVEGGDTILAAFPAGLQRSARRALERRGVELRLGAAVTGVEAGRVTLAGGSALDGATVVWAAGVRAVPLADALGVALGRAARVKVEPTLNLPGRPEVFVVGDMAYLEGYHGGAYPMVAQVAMQMGKWAAYNIRAQLAGRPPRPFRYFDFGQMAMVGRGAAVFESYRLRLAGVVAWLLWLGVHLFYLPGLRNRLTALTSWLAALLTGEAPARPGRPRRAELGPRAPAR